MSTEITLVAPQMAQLHAALHGSSSSGNLNLMSVVKTSDAQRKSHRRELRFGQPMVDEAPQVLTSRAGRYRTRQSLAQRDARAGFAGFISRHVAGYDAIILAQSITYAPDHFAVDSKALIQGLRARGFLHGE